MDKLKTNLMIIIAVLVVLCIVLIGYSANLNAQLGAEKTKTMQLNDQIAGLTAKVKDVQSQLAGANTKTSDQANVVTSLQGSVDSLKKSLDTADTELANLKTAYVNLESKLKEQAATAVPQPEVK
jgi:peptidoglycan hydrolase CwlO-like protein